MKKILIIFLLFLFGCGGSSNQEAKVSEPIEEKYEYRFSVYKSTASDSWQLYEIDLDDPKNYISVKFTWINEYSKEQARITDGSDIVIYLPYSDLKYSVYNYITNEIYEEGGLQ